jgi:flagellar protein FliS
MSDYAGGAFAKRARSSYAEHAALTASPEKLVAMLFAGANARLERAEAAARRGDRREMLKALSSAGAIVAELRGALDFERGGNIADDLFRLYGFVLDRLRRASMERTPEPVAEARLVMGKLQEGWDQLVAGA